MKLIIIFEKKIVLATFSLVETYSEENVKCFRSFSL